MSVWYRVLCRYVDDEGKDDPVTVSFTQKAGTVLDILIGRERFHAPELLFEVRCCLVRSGVSPAR